MTTVYFIRHAEPNYANRDEFSRDLTPKGIAQSERLLDVFRGIDIDVFFSSPYKRAVDTIYPLANSRKKNIHLKEKLCERRIGTWVDNFDEFSQKQWQDFGFHLKNGESLHRVQQRNIAMLHEILINYPNQTIVIGTHGTALSTIIKYYQADFGYQDFNANKHKFPWIMAFEFDGIMLKHYHEISHEIHMDDTP